MSLAGDELNKDFDKRQKIYDEAIAAAVISYGRSLTEDEEIEIWDLVFNDKNIMDRSA